MKTTLYATSTQTKRRYYIAFDSTKTVPNQPFEDCFCEEKLPSDEEVIIPEDDIYTITCET